jgi:glutathione S-transferase
MGFELYIIPGGLYPRRVLLYLAEKDLLDSSSIKLTPVTTTVTLKATAPGKPPGSLPILALGDGTFIKQSIPIIEYFEDLRDGAQSLPPYNPSSNREIGKAQQEMLVTAKGTMRGRTAEEKARTREILGLADEATTHFSFACHKGSAMFSPMERQSPVTSKPAIDSCRKTMALIEEYYEKDFRFKEGVNSGRDEPPCNATTADCVLFSLVQFAEIMYGVDLVQELPNLLRFKQWFEKRENAKVEGMLYDEKLKKIASH